MPDPFAISEAVNSSVNNFFWTRAVIVWLHIGLSLGLVIFFGLLLFIILRKRFPE